MPSKYEEITDYGGELEGVQKEKRQYIEQICRLLDLGDSNHPTDDLVEAHRNHRVIEWRAIGQRPTTEVVGFRAVSV